MQWYDDDGPTHTDDDAPDAPPAKRSGVRTKGENGKGGTKHANGNGRARAPVVRIDTGQLDEREGWERALACTDKGPTKDVGNACLMCTYDAAFRDSFRHDTFRDRVLVQSLPPLPFLPDSWEYTAIPIGGEISDAHTSYVGLWLRRKWGQTYPAEAVRTAIIYAAQQHAFNPLTSYLESCHAAWDRKPRVEEWLATYLGVERSVYASAVGRMWLISACARAFEPGCQADYMLILEGSQRTGKTSAARILASGVQDSFLARLPQLTDLDRAAFAIQGKWIGEVGELDALRGASATRQKDFLTTLIDTYRAPYARYYVNRGRTIVFIGTTNQDRYLVDETGGDRYWSVRTGRILLERLRDDRDQLLGEAVELYRNKVQWWPTDDMWPEIRRQQRDRYEIDEWQEPIEDWAARHESVLTTDLLATVIGLERKDWTPYAQQRIGKIMRHLGWISREQRVDGDKRRRWHRS